MKKYRWNYRVFFKNLFSLFVFLAYNYTIYWLLCHWVMHE